MNKLYIIGDVGSGKTTLSKKISKEQKIETYELDTIVWKKTDSGRYKRTEDEQINEIDKINQNDQWIIEGTYRKCSNYLFEISDCVIFLDTPSWIKKYRILSRYMRQQLRIEKSHYKSDFKMLRKMFKWNNDFDKNKVTFINMLSKYNEKLIIIRKSNEIIRGI